MDADTTIVMVTDGLRLQEIRDILPLAEVKLMRSFNKTQKTGLKFREVSKDHFSSNLNKKSVLPFTHVVVRLLEGRNLLASDVSTGKSDPICFLCICQESETPNFDVSEVNKGHVMVSKVCNCTVDPVWNEDVILPVVFNQIDDILSLKLSILVRDEDINEDKSISYDDLGMLDISFRELLARGRILKNAIIISAKRYLLSKTPNMRRIDGSLKLTISMVFSEEDCSVHLNRPEINAKSIQDVIQKLKLASQNYLTTIASTQNDLIVSDPDNDQKMSVDDFLGVRSSEPMQPKKADSIDSFKNALSSAQRRQSKSLDEFPSLKFLPPIPSENKVNRISKYSDESTMDNILADADSSPPPSYDSHGLESVGDIINPTIFAAHAGDQVSDPFTQRDNDEYPENLPRFQKLEKNLMKQVSRKSLNENEVINPENSVPTELTIDNSNTALDNSLHIKEPIYTDQSVTNDMINVSKAPESAFDVLVDKVYDTTPNSVATGNAATAAKMLKEVTRQRDMLQQHLNSIARFTSESIKTLTERIETVEMKTLNAGQLILNDPVDGSKANASNVATLKPSNESRPSRSRNSDRIQQLREFKLQALASKLSQTTGSMTNPNTSSNRKTSTGEFAAQILTKGADGQITESKIGHDESLDKAFQHDESTSTIPESKTSNVISTNNSTNLSSNLGRYVMSSSVQRVNWSKVESWLHTGDIISCFTEVLDRGDLSDLNRMMEMTGPRPQDLSVFLRNRIFDNIAIMLSQNMHVERCLIWTLALVRGKESLLETLSKYTRQELVDALQIVGKEPSRRGLLSSLLSAQIEKNTAFKFRKSEQLNGSRNSWNVS